jgi:hypothetical protein
MLVFVSGEGTTDFGTGNETRQDYYRGEDYLPGPMTYFVDRIIEAKYSYSVIDCHTVVFVHSKKLESIKETMKSLKLSKIRLPSKHIKIETRFHFEDARALTSATKEYLVAQTDKDFVAILFRDSNTNDQTEWKSKWNSMQDGFRVGFDVSSLKNKGVPMLPKPISEAWLLCAIYRKEDRNKNCNKLEERKHGQKKEHALKWELEKKIGEKPNRYNIISKIESDDIDVNNINLPSFIEFKKRLENVLSNQ